MTQSAQESIKKYRFTSSANNTQVLSKDMENEIINILSYDIYKFFIREFGCQFVYCEKVKESTNFNIYIIISAPVRYYFIKYLKYIKCGWYQPIKSHAYNADIIITWGDCKNNIIWDEPKTITTTEQTVVTNNPKYNENEIKSILPYDIFNNIKNIYECEFIGADKTDIVGGSIKIYIRTKNIMFRNNFVIYLINEKFSWCDNINNSVKSKYGEDITIYGFEY